MEGLVAHVASSVMAVSAAMLVLCILRRRHRPIVSADDGIHAEGSKRRHADDSWSCSACRVSAVGAIPNQEDMF